MSTEQLTGVEALRASIKSMAALAREIGVQRSAIQKWTKVPAERVAAVSKATGIPPQILRPDLYEVAN
jgi:DNA-binding transcriptional regulator YdaS (Cro superfamily)